MKPPAAAPQVPPAATRGRPLPPAAGAVLELRRPAARPFNVQTLVLRPHAARRS